MNKIIKTKAVVLKKQNYGDSSLILSLYTEEEGRLSAILKGARKSKTNTGAILDPLNLVEIVIYIKKSREVQLISSADLISNYSLIKDDIYKLKYAYSSIEIIQYLTSEEEKDEKLFKGLVRILDLFNKSEEISSVIFCRFFLFIIKEMGYQFSFKKCAICNSEDIENEELAFNFELGLLCGNCKADHLTVIDISKELFEFFFCLRNNKKIINNAEYLSSKALYFMETYLKYHINSFNGLKSLKLID
ncbi:MAG: DNA repair protein RecO [Ignavibacteriales bacterium CG12_big_fil_rev_8_21_14_0_65_30_8]|nr:MAG: DNA repair protein RecO [Ignavibacteriales bacterium CG12_big_fil_rev_8_21_14_0_65_30_8]